RRSSRMEDPEEIANTLQYEKQPLLGPIAKISVVTTKSSRPTPLIKVSPVPAPTPTSIVEDDVRNEEDNAEDTSGSSAILTPKHSPEPNGATLSPPDALKTNGGPVSRKTGRRFSQYENGGECRLPCLRTFLSDNNLLRRNYRRNTRPRIPSLNTILEKKESEESRYGENRSLASIEQHLPLPWANSTNASESFVHYFTLLYALVVVIFLVVEEAAHHNGEHPFGIIFHYYMYGVGILFVVYVNLFIINPSLVNRLRSFFADSLISPACHTSEPVSTLLLRLGTFVFGCAGVVMYGLELNLLITGKADTSFPKMSILENILGVGFVFSQMQFMNSNFKLLIQTSRNICRFGFMHCFATNIWMWYRFAQAKAIYSLKKLVAKEQERRMLGWFHLRQIGSRAASSSSPLTTLFRSTYTSTIPFEDVRSPVASLEYYGSFAALLNTCVIEYAVIGATVMFVFWTKLDPSTRTGTQQKRRSVGIYFGSSRCGFYMGVLMFLVGVSFCAAYAGSRAAYQLYPSLHAERRSFLLLGEFECISYCCSILAVIAACISVRYFTMHGEAHAHPVVLYLLYVAFCAEVVWCCAELARFIDVGGHRFIFTVALLRLAHVVSQTWFILVAFKLAPPPSSTTSFGRQCVTFQLMTNATLFFFHIFESMTSGFGYVNSSSSNYTYVKLLAGQLITFYRFHSCVCLVEVWKATFARRLSAVYRQPERDITPWRLASVVSMTDSQMTFSMSDNP
ncbi:hypothetical protein PENTCL1PPCAC_14182, partial [Pristionchus entomophagus]